MVTMWLTGRMCIPDCISPEYPLSNLGIPASRPRDPSESCDLTFGVSPVYRLCSSGTDIEDRALVDTQVPDTSRCRVNVRTSALLAVFAGSELEMKMLPRVLSMLEAEVHERPLDTRDL